MMTEEQLIDRICLTCVDVRHAATEESAQKFINDIRGLAEQLAALTQPASPALKLPDEMMMPIFQHHQWADRAMAQKEVDSWNACLAEVKRLNAPHTAPIEPICATGGAEWTVNSLANDALIMLDRIDISDSADDDRIEEVKRIVRLLSAEQEGK